jgi:hypothetical protein
VIREREVRRLIGERMKSRGLLMGWVILEMDRMMVSDH